MLAISINLNDRKARNNIGRIIDNLPIMMRKTVRKTASTYAGTLRRKLAGRHRFTGDSRKRVKAVPLGKNRWGVTAPEYLKFLETGTRTHWVSMTRHPIVLKWIIQKGIYPPLFQKGNSIKIRTLRYMIFSETIRESRPKVRTQIKQDWDRFNQSRGRVAR